MAELVQQFLDKVFSTFPFYFGQNLLLLHISVKVIRCQGLPGLPSLLESCEESLKESIEEAPAVQLHRGMAPTQAKNQESQQLLFKSTFSSVV